MTIPGRTDWGDHGWGEQGRGDQGRGDQGRGDDRARRALTAAPQHGAPPHGAPPYSAPPHGAPQHGAPPHGAPPHGAPPHGQARRAALPSGALSPYTAPVPRHRHSTFPVAHITPDPVRRPSSRRRRKRAWAGGLLLVSPSLLALAVFIYGFIGWNVRVSFTSWRGLTPRYDFVGLHNYIALWSDERWRIDVRNIVVFTGVLVVGALALGFAMAMMLDRGTRGEGLLRGVFLFPMALSFIATGIVWRWLLDNGTGSQTTGLNKLFSDVGLGFLRSDWHRSDSGWAVAAVALPAGWALSGYVMALFLAGMRTIPDDLREAARIDGASETQVFWHVTRPLLRPALLSALVILVHISLKSFDLLYALDQRNLKIDTPSLYMWFTTFDGGFLNRGATIATLLLIGVVLVIGPYIWYSVRTEQSR